MSLREQFTRFIVTLVLWGVIVYCAMALVDHFDTSAAFGVLVGVILSNIFSSVSPRLTGVRR